MKKSFCFSILFSLITFFCVSKPSFSQDLTKGLVAYWPFCGCNVHDATSNGHDGTLAGSPQCVSGKFDQAYQFNGSNTIDVPFSTAFDIPTDSALTLAAWVNPSRVGDFYQALVVKGTNAAWDYGIYMDISGGFMFGTSYPNHETISTTKPVAGQWYHVCGVYRNGSWKLFINGKLESSDLSGSPIGRSTNGVGMAKKGISYNDMYAGALDEVRFYSRALSDSEVAELYRLSPIGICGITPVISYLIPDIGAPGMNVYTEFIAPYNAVGNFGTDGLYTNNPGDPVRVVCAKSSDTSKLILGPAIVSWNGRVVSTQVFIKTCATPNSADWRALDSEFKVPLKVIVGGVPSNTDTFFIVSPHAGLVESGGGVLDGGWVRSKRGALLFDSISLSGGTYTVSTTDCDPYTASNQGFLPVTILSKGPVRIMAGATLSTSAIGKDAGPGGGGGSLGDGPPGNTGGSGFVGGAPGEDTPCPATGGPGTGGNGTGGRGGVGLNLIPPEPSDVPNCEYFGGTGNPFVSEGGGVVIPMKHEGDGNGGGFGTAGDYGRGERTGAPELGGIANGNSMLVPFMGGSGGGGGNEFCSCDEDQSTTGALAGGGGGAVCLYAPQISASGCSVQSNGFHGVSGGVGCVGHGSVGGCGSGGGILLESKLSSTFPSASAAGGASLHNTQPGNGSGGAGRIRFDGPISNAITFAPDTATFYRGLSTDTSHFSSGTVTLTGTGNGDTIRIYTKSGFAPWVLATTVGDYSNNQWSKPIPVPAGQVTYAVAMQEVPNPSTDGATMEPSWVMSQAAANIFNAGASGTSSTPQLASLPFNSVTGCSDTSVWEPISIGCAQFRIDSVRIQSDGAGVFHLNSKQKLPRTIGYNGSDSVHVIFVPLGQAGTFHGFVHVYGTLIGSGTPFDTLLPLKATSTSTGNPLPAIHYTPFATVQACADGDAYAFLKLGCAQFRIDSVKIEQDTGNAFAVDPTQKFPQTLTANKSDSIHVLFDPNNRIGSFGARLHVYGTDLGSGTIFDTVLTLFASSILPTPVFYTFPTQIDWLSVTECSSGDTAITFQNDGCDTVSVDSLQVIPGLTLGSLGLPLPRRVAPKHTIQLRVHFSPDGMKSDSLEALLYFSAPGFRDSIQVQVYASALAAAPVLAANTPAVNFGQLPACDTVDSVIFLKNMGCDSLTITSLSELPGDFSNDPPITLPITIAKGDSIALHFTYHPTSQRDTQSVFVGTTNGKQTGTVKLSLSGRIGVGQISVSLLPVTLSSVAICGEADTSITLSNPGCDTIVITSASLSPSGDLQLVGATPPIILPPHSDTLLHLHFAAQQSEFVTSTLTLIYSSAGIVQSQIPITINALATNPMETLALSDTAISIASLPICESDSLFAELYNPSCDTLVVSANNITGDSDFVLLSALDSIRIWPGDSARVRIALLPRAKGVRNGTLHVRYTNLAGTNGPHDTTIDISALVTNGTRLVTESISSANMGTISECSSADTVITLQNLGCDTLEIDAAALDNANFTLAPTNVFPLHLSPDSSFSWSIETNLDTAGRPTAAGAILRFTSPDTVIPPVSLSYSIRYAVPSSLTIVPMTGSARADSSIYYDIRDQAMLANAVVSDIRFALHTSRDVLGYDSASSLNGVAEDSSNANGVANYDFDITGSPIQQQPDGTIARLWFKTYVAQTTETPLWIDSTRLDPTDPNFERCTAYLLPPADTSFNLIQGCGDKQLQELMSGNAITMRIQNDGDRTLIVVHSPEAIRAHLRISNLLGAIISEEDIPLNDGETDYAIPASLQKGPLFLMLSNSSGPLARAAAVRWR